MTRAANKRGFMTKIKAEWSFKILQPLQPSIIHLLMGQTHLLLTETRLSLCRANPSTPGSWHDNVWYATIHSCYHTNGTRHNRLFKGLMVYTWTIPHAILHHHKLPDTVIYCVPYITGTAARKLTQMIKNVSTLGSSRHSSDNLNDLSTKFDRPPEHAVLENPLATTQTAMVPSIQNTRAHQVTLDTKNETW
jgi:hypothetical protein